MNRDERRDRPAGLLPALRDDVPVLAPADPTAGGSWIGVRADGGWAARDARGVPTLHLDEYGDPRRAVLTTRPASQTVSITQVVLTSGAAPLMRYWDERALGGVPSALAAPWAGVRTVRFSSH